MAAMADASTEKRGPRQVRLDELAGYAGQTLGHSAWYTITQEQVDRFADATRDHQWIHVDPVRAKDGPFGRTIAHGYLTLSMAPALLFEMVAVAGAGLVINYGANRVRFPAPVFVGSRLRATVDLLEVTPIDVGVQTVFRMTFEAEGTEKPVCVAELVYRYYRT
jgi:acyl dehydratase